MADEHNTNDLKELYKSLSWQLLEVTENAAMAAARAAGTAGLYWSWVALA